MPQGRGRFTVDRVNMGASRGIIIKHLGRRRRSPSDAGGAAVGQRYNGRQRISNARLPLHRQQEDEARRAELRGWLCFIQSKLKVLNSP
jgi:hypothetical protein